MRRRTGLVTSLTPRPRSRSHERLNAVRAGPLEIRRTRTIRAVGADGGLADAGTLPSDARSTGLCCQVDGFSRRYDSQMITRVSTLNRPPLPACRADCRRAGASRDRTNRIGRPANVCRPTRSRRRTGRTSRAATGSQGSMYGTRRVGRDSGLFTTPPAATRGTAPPISRVWEDSADWFQLFACALFVQSKNGGGPRLAPMVELILSGPPVSSSLSNATKLEFDGWPRHGSGPHVHPPIQAFIDGRPRLQTGAARSEPRRAVGHVRNLFANVGLEQVGGQVRLGVLGQRYRAYFAGKPGRLPTAGHGAGAIQRGAPSRRALRRAIRLGALGSDSGGTWQV